MAKKSTKKTAKKVVKKDDFMAKIQKSLKTKTVIVTDTMESFIPWKVPFRNKALQKITGGLLGGRVMCVDAMSQNGKSWLLYELMGSCIQMGGAAYLIDTERAFEPAYARSCGVDLSLNRLLIDESTVIENFGLSIKTFIQGVREEIKDKSIPIVIGIDSTAGTRCLGQYENDEKGKSTGFGSAKRANAMYEMVDVLIPLLDEQACSLVIIGQLRKKMDASPFENPYKTMFENLEYRATQMLRGFTSTIEKDDDDKVKKLGMTVRWETYKNRFVKPKQQVKVKYQYESGLLPYSGLFEVLVREGELVKKDISNPDDGRKKIKGCYVANDPEKTFYALKEAKKLFEDYPHLLEPKYVEIHEEEDANEETLADLESLE